MILKSPHANQIPFDKTGTTMVSDIANDAIVEAYNKSGGVSKGFIFSSYNGNANVGRFLELFPGIDSNLAPLYTSVSLDVIEVVARSTATSTASIGFYNLTTLIYTVVFTAQTERILSSPTFLFQIAAGGNLKIKIDSGSINNPHLYFVTRGTV